MTQLACVDATVTRREELSEHLVRVHVAGEQLRTMPWGEQGPGPRADSYVKVLIPPAGGAVDVDVADMARWRREFMAAPREEAGWMRTYTVRDATTVELAGQRVPELAIDVVLHGDPEHGMGPGAAWGDSVRTGDSARLLVPAGDSAWWAAWDDGRAAGQDVVIAGDETALPAISAIVDGVEQRVRVNRPADGTYEPPRSITVAVEVPEEADAVPGAGPRALARAASYDEHGAHRVVLDGGTELVWTWLPRGTRERNLALELWLWERLAEHARRY
ncbi:siderophore-interacting protein, partial [Kocuria rhizophila]